MKIKPLISVILPVYNQENYIGEAVESILDQTYQNLELVIVNDRSTDKSSEVIKRYKDPRIQTFTTKENLKLAKLLNTYIPKCKGEFIARMDADDLSLPNRLKEQLAFFCKNPDIDIVGSHTELFGHKAGKIWRYPLTHEAIKAQLLFSNAMSHPSVMFRKSSWQKNSILYDTHFFRYQDYKLWSEAIDKLKFANIPKVLIKHRVYEDQLSEYYTSTEKNKLRIAIWKSILKKNLNIIPTQKQLKLHSSLADLTFTTSKYSFGEYSNWIQIILSANRVTNYYDQIALNKTLENFWFLSGSCSKLSLIKVLQYLQNPLSKSISNDKKYRFIKNKFAENLTSILN